MCKVIGQVTAAPCFQRPSSSANSLTSRSRFPAVSPSSAPSPVDIEKVGIGDHRRLAPPDRAARHQSLGDDRAAAATRQPPRRGRQDRAAIGRDRRRARRAPAHRASVPNGQAAPCRRNRAAAAAGRPAAALLCHSSLGSASSSNSPPAAHPAIEFDQHLGRLRARMRHQQQRLAVQAGAHRQSRSERHCSAARSRLSAADPPPEIENCSANSNGRLVSSASVGRSAGARGPAPARAPCPICTATAAPPTSNSAATSASAALHQPRRCAARALAGIVGRLARRNAQLGQRIVGLGAIVAQHSAAGCRGGSSPDRLIAVPSRTSRKTNASPVSPMRMRCIRSLLLGSCMRRMLWPEAAKAQSHLDAAVPP